MHQDDQGQLSSRSKIVLKDDGRQPWRSPSASPVGMTPAIRSRRLVLPTAPRSLMSTGLTTICRRRSRLASLPGAWVGDGDTAFGFHDRDTVQRQGCAALLPDWQHSSRHAEVEMLRDLARTVRHAVLTRRHARGRDPRAGLAWLPGRRPSHGEVTHAQEAAAMAARRAHARRHVRRGLARSWCAALLTSQVGTGRQRADPARYADAVDPEQRLAGADARDNSPLPRSERRDHRPAEQGGGVT
jgi:hypothetical protein